MSSISPRYKITQFSKQRGALKWMNSSVLQEHDKCGVTLHMSVFNPEHTLHPPGHSVHMSGIGTTVSCQCLIPGWICLNQTHAWMDVCACRLYCSDDVIMTFPRHTHSDGSLEALISVDQLALVVTQPVPWACIRLSTYYQKVWCWQR